VEAVKSWNIPCAQTWTAFAGFQQLPEPNKELTFTFFFFFFFFGGIWVGTQG
jgi:hypothetical protein